ncbi:MAG: two-component regulator propeller domain-containing protein [Acidobacteriota bacterium]|nr:two-component regulator propeller domain-containing protein [Acidobacteriota bacterium]
MKSATRSGYNRLSFLFIFWMMGPVVESGEIRLSSIERDRLPFQESVTSILQDQKGFIWFGTLNGLYRYDGIEIVTYRHKRDSANGLPHNLIFGLFEDQQGMIWINTHGGLSRFDPVHDRFKNYLHRGDDSGSLPHNRSSAVHQDARGRIWVATRGGAAVIEAEEITRIYRHKPDDPESLAADWTWSLAPDDAGGMWVGTKTGLSHYRPDKDGFDQVLPLQNRSIYALYREEANLWVGTENNGVYLVRENDEGYWIKHYPLTLEKPGLVTALGRDRDGTLWVGTDGDGVAELVDRRSGRFVIYQSRNDEPDTLSDNRVLAITSDRSGLLWFGTFSGPNRLNPNSRVFKNLDAGDGLSDSRIWSIHKDHRDRLWVGTWNGLNLVTEDGVQVFHHDPADPASLAHDEVLAITRDRRNRIWIGTGNGISTPRESGGFQTFRHDPRNPRSLSNSRVFSIAEDRFGKLWITTADGLNRMDDADGRFTRFMPDPIDYSGPSPGGLTLLFKDRTGSLWLGTVEGLNRIEQAGAASTPVFMHYRRQKEYALDLYDHYIVSLNQDRAGRLLIGTSLGLGIVRFAGDRPVEVRQFTEDEGLSDNIIYGILEDNEGLLWVSTGKGVDRIDPQSGEVRNYGRPEGLSCLEYNQFGYFKDGNGVLYFGGDKGIDSFLPADMRTGNYPPPVVFTSFKKAFEEAELPRRIAYTDKISVPLKENYLTFSFAAMDFTAPFNNRFQYIMEGNDDRWIDAGRSNTATYTNLEPGTYTFRVKAANNDGVWSRESADLVIDIIPPLWMTNWFRILLVVFIAALLYLGHRLRLISLQKQKQVLQDMVAAGTRDLRTQKRLLEDINGIVRTINKEMGFISLLKSILEQTRVLGADESFALVYDPATRFFYIPASLPAERYNPTEQISHEDLTQKFLAGAREVHPNIHMGNGKLILRIYIDSQGHGYLVYAKDYGDFDEAALSLLVNLEEHLVSALVKNRLLRELRIVNEKKNEFMGMAAHDLRGPLGSILSYADVIYHELAGEPVVSKQTKDDLLLMRNSTARILSLLNELLDISAIESGKVELNQSRLDIREILEEVKRLYQRPAGEKGIDLKIQHGDPAPYVLGDRTRLFEVFENLVGNAIKFTDSGGEVRVSYGRDNGFLVMRVADTGQGIADDELQHIFTRFKRLGSKPTAGEGGVGLGLAIAKKVVELHNGRIWVKSERRKGTTFCFTLPPAGDEIRSNE